MCLDRFRKENYPLWWQEANRSNEPGASSRRRVQTSGQHGAGLVEQSSQAVVDGALLGHLQGHHRARSCHQLGSSDHTQTTTDLIERRLLGNNSRFSCSNNICISINYRNIYACHSIIPDLTTFYILWIGLESVVSELIFINTSYINKERLISSWRRSACGLSM